jgi:drug/metabolite transporter (DMT)-like permease
MSFGIFLIVLFSAITHAFWNFIARLVKGNIAILWLALLIASAACLPFTFLRGWSLESVSAAYPYMLATGIIHAFYFRLLAWCYEHGEISVVYPIARGTGVAGASLLAYLLMGEQVSVYGATGIGFVCVGTVLVGFSDIRSGRFRIGIGVLALSVGATISIYSLVDKAGVGLIDPEHYILSLFFLAALFLTPYVIVRHRDALVEALRSLKRYSLLIGLGSIGTYLIILFAFQIEKLSYIVAVREFAVVIGAILGLTILKERPTYKKLLGITAITAGMILIKLA